MLKLNMNLGDSYGSGKSYGPHGKTPLSQGQGMSMHMMGGNGKDLGNSHTNTNTFTPASQHSKMN